MTKASGSDPIRVLLVEDSPTQQALLLALLKASGEFDVVGAVGNGRDAVTSTIRLRPHIVAMDVHLPVMDGYEATRQIMERCPTPIVMFSNSAGDADRRSMRALAAGALAVVRKPGSFDRPESLAERQDFLKMLRLMSVVRVVTRHPSRTPLTQVHPIAPALPIPRVVTRPQLIAVAASTGGPAAVQQFLSGIGPHFSLPIVVAQHIARSFTQALVDWLAGAVPQPVRIAQAGERLQGGYVYFAPDDQHILLHERGVLGVRNINPEDRYCPSADLLFESVARTYGPSAIGVIMTGMGDDGARGMKQLHDTGALTLAQNEATCVVYGMPGSAAALGAVRQILPISDLATAVLGVVST